MSFEISNSSTSRSLLIGLTLIVLVKLWLIAPQEIVARSSPHDDTLFIGLALNILQGEWLGDYNQFTLMKGPGYSLFIVASNLLGLPLILSQELLYIAACLLFVWCLKRLGTRTSFLWVAFAALLFNPFTYNFFPNVYPFRFGIYPAVSLIVFSLAMHTAISAERGERTWPLLFLFGLALGWFWNIRGEAVWIAPSLALFLLYYVVVTWRFSPGAPVSRILRPTITAILISGIGFAIVNSTIAYKNYRTYGVYTTNEMKSPAFRAAYGGLLRIETVQWERFIPVNREARNIAYSVSPSFKKLEDYFEYGRGTQSWMKGGSDYIAAFFPWAFRDALSSIGYFRNAPRTHAFLQAIGEEIDDACEAKRIKCRARYSELAPKWHSEWNGLAVNTFVDTLKQFVKFKGFVANGPRVGSMDDDKLVINYKYVTRSLIRPQRNDLLSRVPDFHKARVETRRHLFGKIVWLYRHVPQILFVLGFAGLFWRAYRIFRGERISSADILSLALLGGLFTYAFILTILQVTSYTSIGRQLNTTYPIVLAFIMSWIRAVCPSDALKRD